MLRSRVVFVIMMIAIVALALSGLIPAAAQSSSAAGVTTLKGAVTSQNPFVLADSEDAYIALIDLTAFVKRDKDMKLPFPDQLIVGIEGELDKGAAYTMPLPIEPRARLNDVSNGKGDTKGVAIFSTDYVSNSIGDPFQGPFEWRGWPNGLDSLKYDPGTLEVIGGRMIVWSPDDKQMFPTAFGDDGKLFTKDDPVGSLAPGWTVFDLDRKPFEAIRTREVDVPIIEGAGALNDLSKLTYTQAFDALVKDLRIRYTFTEYKKIDWDALVRDIRPLVEKAEQAKDQQAFNIAMTRFVARFNDGHVSVSTPNTFFQQQTEGGLGMVLGQTDDGVVIAWIVLDKLPAAGAGIKAGAKILEWNSQPIGAALEKVELLFAPQSSPHAIRLQQLRYLMRAPVGTKFTVKFQNPDEDAKTAEMTTVKENESQTLSSFNYGRKPEDMPITVRVLLSGMGYIKIGTFSGDNVLLVKNWEWALDTMRRLRVPGLIVDMRQNGGGSGLVAAYFAGSFHTESFVLNESYEADKDGKFIYVGKDLIEPAPNQWTKPVAVLVGPACASACEIFAAAVAHDPNHLIVGRYPSAGVEAGVHPWNLPGGLYFQAPIVQLRYPDGKIFLEGVGVVPNVKVPVTVESLLSTDDPEIPAAEKALQAQIEKLNATPPTTQKP